MNLFNKAIFVAGSFFIFISAQANNFKLYIEFTPLTETNISISPTETKRIEY